MQDKNPNGVAQEIKLVPTWAWILAGVVFIAAQIFFNVWIGKQHDAPPAWARPLLGLLAGFAGGCYLLLVGYVNRDSGRRGMSRVLWTIVAVIIPNALGFILYFLLRQPLRGSCPQCAAAIQPGFNFCPRCSCKLALTCQQCQHSVSPADSYCPNCGASIRGQSAAIPGTPVVSR